MVIDDDLLDYIEANGETIEQETELASHKLANKRVLEQAQKNLLARKRIDELMDKKRLKELLDDSDDW